MGLVGKPKGRDHFEDVDLDGRMILKWVLKKQDGRGCTGFIWLRVGTGGAVLNTVMNLRTKKRRKFVMSLLLLASEKGLYCFELKILIILMEKYNLQNSSYECS